MKLLRGLLPVACTALAYAMLRGWPDAMPAFARTCLAAFVWLAGFASWGNGKPGKDAVRAKPHRQPRWTDRLAIGTAMLAVACAFLWLLAAAPAPLESAGLAVERQFRPAEAARRAVSTTADARPGNWLWTEETRRPLPKRTNFKPGLKPEVFLRISDPADAAFLLRDRVHVRAFALGRYENAAWSPLPGNPLEITADDSGFVRLAADFPGREIAHEVFHSADAGGQNAFIALQGATLARISPLRRVDDGLHLLPPAPSGDGYQYQAVSRPKRIEDLPDAGLIAAWPDAPADLLALPENAEFADRLRTLARSAAGSGSVKNQLLQLQESLRTRFSYSLASTNPRGIDPIENFLFEEKRGHCEYFATAGALLARALGLPSRVAYGWAGGTWYEGAGLFVFRANEAHAWTEIWLENHGWVLMDPTPQTAGTGPATRVAPPGEPLPTTPAADPQKSPTPPAAATTANLPRLGLWLTLLFFIPSGLLFLLRGRRKDADGRDVEAGVSFSGETAPDYLRLWRQACAVRGEPLPPGATLRRQVAVMRDAPEFARELVDYHYAVRYEGRPADARVEKRLIRRIRGWRAEFSGISNAGRASHPCP